MRVWWCEEHEAPAQADNRLECWWGYVRGEVEKCRMVEMQLLPLNARVAIGDDILIHRDTDGNWPLSIIDALNADGFDGWAVQEIIERFAFNDTETP